MMNLNYVSASILGIRGDVLRRAEGEAGAGDRGPQGGAHDPVWRSPSSGIRVACRATPEASGVAKLAKFGQNFANFGRARSRLYQNEFLQENMRLTAFFKLYKICILLHRCNLKIFAKNRFEKSAIFVKIQQNFANVAKFANFKFC